MFPLLLWWIPLLFSGLKTSAVPYDYTATIECLATPHKPQYGGGIIVNPNLNDGLKGWSTFGDAKMEHREALGNKFIVAHRRINPHDSVSQKFYLHKKKLYTFSAWIQVSEGSAPVTAVFKTNSGLKYAGAAFGKSNCWSMLKGGLSVDVSSTAELYFESKNTSVEIWVDSISLQPFTEKEWRSHQYHSIQKARKSKLRIQAVDNQGDAIPNATISIHQKDLAFPLGCAMNKNILTNKAYQNWFASRFKLTVFENEMKWNSTESKGSGFVDYSVPDAMINFTKANNIAVRGHNVLWDRTMYQPNWVLALNDNNLRTAAVNRVNSVVSRYKGQVIDWDVVNENLHNSFFESKLGDNASVIFYDLARKVDPGATMFMNEFNTIEDSRDPVASPVKYLEKLKQISDGSPGIKLGIGLESHFSEPAINIAYMRSAIDMLGSSNLPIRLTEVDVVSGPNQANFLEQILREGHAHPKVVGIVIWAAWTPTGCYKMCLTDNNFMNLATGDVVDKLLQEWGGRLALNTNPLTFTTDSNGYFEVNLFLGDYEIRVQDHKFNVSLTPEEEEEEEEDKPTMVLRVAA